MGHTFSTLLGLSLGSALLAACSGSADSGSPEPSPSTSPSPSTPSSTPTSTPPPSAPVMPEAAKAHTKAGAKAFVEYFWEVVNYAEVTGDTESLTPTFVPGCRACEGGVAGIRKIYRSGGRITGGLGAVEVRRVRLSYAGPFLLADVALTLTTAQQRVDFPGTDRDQIRSGAVARDAFHLSATQGAAWKVAQFEVLS